MTAFGADHAGRRRDTPVGLRHRMGQEVQLERRDRTSLGFSIGQRKQILTNLCCRRLFNPDRRTVPEQEASIHGVLEFSDVSRPVMGLEPAQRVGIERMPLAIEALTSRIEEMFGEQGNVSVPLAQRRDPKAHHIEAV